MGESHGLSRRLWLLAALRLAKALAEPSPMARLGLAQTGSARPGIRLWARPGTSLLNGMYLQSMRWFSGKLTKIIDVSD